MPESVNEFLQSIPARLMALLTLDVALQAAAFLLIFPLSRLVVRYVRPPLDRLQERVKEIEALANFAWLDDLFVLIKAILQPLGAWLLGRAALAGLEGAGRDTAVLAWAVPFFALWLLYRFLVTLARLRLPPAQAEQQRQRLIRPFILIIGLLQATGLLDDVLRSGAEFGGNRITVQATIIGLAIIYIFMLLARNSRQLLGDSVLPRIGVEASLTQILATFVGYAIILFGLVTGLNVIGIPLTTLTVIAGGLSVGVGFGMQEVISNFISGFILLFERSIGPGDIVEVEGTVGVVENIGIRAMRIKNFDNIELIVPNNDFLTNTVTNFTRGDRRVRVHVGVGVTYDANPREVEGLLLTAATHEHILTDPPPSVHFINFGDSSLDFELLVWTDDAAIIPGLRSDLRYNIWQVLTDAAIEIPFPQRDIHIRTAVPAAPPLS